MKLLLYSEVCKKCWLVAHDGDDTWWSDDDQETFSKGSGFCCPQVVSGSNAQMITASETPPQWCPYKFEHAVGVGVEDVK
jgi:hypothetical protein